MIDNFSGIDTEGGTGGSEYFFFSSFPLFFLLHCIP